MRVSAKVLLILLATSLFLIDLPSSHALSRVGAITFNPGESQLASAAIDSAAGYAYFGTGNQGPGSIIKVRLSDFTEVGSLNLTNYGEHNFVAMVADPAHGFLYPASLFGDLVRIRLSDFSRIDAINSPYFQRLSIDPSAGYIYAGSGGGIGGHLTKVRLSDFTQVATTTLNTTDHEFMSTINVDPATGYGYAGTCCNSSIAEIVQFRLSDLTKVNELPLQSGEDVYSSVIDTGAGFAYYATAANTIVKVRLSDLTRNATLTPGYGGLSGGIIDPPHDYAYFGAPGNTVLRIRLSTLTVAGSLILNSGEGLGSASVFDPATGFAYLGQYTSPGIVVKIQTASIPATPSGLTATGGANKISLSWTPPSTNAGAPITSYKLYRGTSSGSETPYQTLGNVTSYQDNNANVSITYYYKVTANNTAGESGFSNEANAAATPAPRPVPSTPVELWVPIVIAAVAAGIAVLFLVMRKRKPTQTASKT